MDIFLNVLLVIAIISNVIAFIKSNRAHKKLMQAYVSYIDEEKQILAELKDMTENTVYFNINVHKDEETGNGYIAHIPAFDCYGDGDTPEEARADVKAVLQDLILADRERRGKP